MMVDDGFIEFLTTEIFIPVSLFSFKQNKFLSTFLLLLLLNCCEVLLVYKCKFMSHYMLNTPSLYLTPLSTIYEFNQPFPACIPFKAKLTVQVGYFPLGKNLTVNLRISFFFKYLLFSSTRFVLYIYTCFLFKKWFEQYKRQVRQ